MIKKIIYEIESFLSPNLRGEDENSWRRREGWRKWSVKRIFFLIYQKESERLKRGSYLLRWDIEGDGTKINFAVSIDAGNDEEDTGTSSSAFEQTTQAENNSSFVFLYHLAARIVMEYLII